MTITRTIIKLGQKPTRKQAREVEAAYGRTAFYDDPDAPAYSYDELTKMKQAADERRALERKEQRKQVIALRLSPETVSKAKATGKGYTGFLARLIENAMQDKELVKKSL